MKVFDTNAYLNEIRWLIEQDHDVTLPVVGSSMTPFLVGDRDSVHICPLGGRQPGKGDIVLYQRANGRYILHRIVRTHADSYDLLGDAHDRIEGGIHQKQIFGVVNACIRKGKSVLPGSFLWWFFARVWPVLRPVRRPIMKLYQALKG